MDQNKQRNLEKELGIYQMEYMQLKAQNVALQAENDDLKMALQQKEESNYEVEASK